MGNIGGRQRPHVALDDVLFLIAQGKHSLRIIARDARVLEAVPMGDVAAVVPVIQVKVMQERTFYKAASSALVRRWMLSQNAMRVTRIQCS